jgi:hypothetical protein
MSVARPRFRRGARAADEERQRIHDEARTRHGCSCPHLSNEDVFSTGRPQKRQPPRPR